LVAVHLSGTKDQEYVDAMKLLRIAVSTLLASGLMTGSAVLPAYAGDRESLDYVALGDSYAAGVGAGSYLNGCAQSLLGYPSLLDERKQIELVVNATCGGDTVAHVAAELTSLNSGTDLVTLTVGGNDVLYQQVIAACGQGTTACQQAVSAAVAGAQNFLAPQLASLYGTINTLAPNATVVVTGYPHLFSPEFGTTIAIPGTPLVLTPTEQQILNDGTDALNAVIQAQAEAAGFTYVDVVQRFDKHGLGSPQPWIQPFTDAGALHPNAKGYKNGYLHEIRNALN
jgi:lysophospholipase L1-like esterase